tara:strand:- start:194 stop:427 length:234 start_codon:yes stop_codon:yes gene_type:complete
MIEWFIVAFVSMPNTDRIEIKLMQESFNSKPACIRYLRDTPEIINDIQILEPTNTGMRFKCLDTKQVEYYKVKRKAI